ncbi:MAG: Immunoglobulin-like protein [Parcubacteria group bacterium GW2011_GWA1_54_9]|nr:MAG: Immunoglobulin-like protein [Parcubacteria group bacterium GW2011_GWA1_54_9]
MKKYLFSVALSLASFSPAFAQAQTTGILTPAQIEAVLQFIQSFNVDQAIIDNVRIALNSEVPATGTCVAPAGTVAGGVAPIITLIYPTNIMAGQPTNIVGYGSNLQSCVTIIYTGSASGSFQLTPISSGKFQFNSSLFSPGSYSFYVKNPDGKSSGGLAFKIGGAQTGGSCSSSPVTTTPAPASAPVAIPSSCFGTGNISGEVKYSNGAFAMEGNKMHVTRFKTESAGYLIGRMGWVGDANVAGSSGFTIGFISSVPCDYTGAYNNGLTARGPGGYGGWVGPKSSYGDLPVLADNQVQTYFDNWVTANTFFGYLPPGLNRKAYLKPNTYYYLNIVNSEEIISPFDQVPVKYIKTDADLTASPDTCLAPVCTYQIIGVNAFRYLPNPTPGGHGGNLIPGLPAPTTSGGTSISCPAPTGGSCGGVIVTPATGGSTVTTSSLKWWSSAEFYVESIPKCEDVGYANIVHGQSCSSEGYKCRKIPTYASTKMELFQCKMTPDTTTAPVNGPCGTSACGSFSSPPTTGLCNTGTASAVSGSGPFSWFCNGSNGGSSVSCSATKSGTGTTPPPPAVSCGAGEVFNTASGDRDWYAENGMHPVLLWPIPPVTGSGSLGRAIKIVADNVKYPRGVQIGGVDEFAQSPGISGGKDYVVSECPHSFVPVAASTFEGRQLCTLTGAGRVAGPFRLRFGPAETRTFFGQTLPTLDCPLTPGGTYYVNFRAYDQSYPTVSSQFVILDRAITSE